MATLYAFLLGAGLCLVAALSCWGFGDQPAPAATAAPPRPASTGHVPATLRILRSPGVPGGMLVSLSLLTAVDVLVAYLPLLGERRGISAGTIGLLLSLRAAASVTSRVLIPPMLARLGRVRLLLLSTLGSGVLLILLPVPDQTWLLAALLVAAGFFLGIGQPLTMALVVQAVPAESRGAALSIRIMANKIGQVIVPAAIGVATGAAGVVWAFPLLGALLLGSAAGVPGPRGPALPPP